MAQVGVCGTDRRVACGAESVLHWVRWVTALLAAEGPLAGGKAWTWHAVWWGAGGLDRAWSTATQSRAKRDCAAKPPEEEREKGEETSEHFKSRTYWRSLGYNLFPWLSKYLKVSDHNVRPIGIPFYWRNMLCFTELLWKYYAWFSRKCSGFLKLTKGRFDSYQAHKIYNNVNILTQSTSKRKGLHHVPSVFSRMTQCFKTLPFCCCVLMIFRQKKLTSQIMEPVIPIPNFSTQ